MTVESATPMRHSTEQRRARRVLVIDDEPGVRRYARRALSAAGYIVREAPGGRAGIDLVMDEPPNLVLLDLGLPDLTGEEVLQAIRANQPQVPVIVWTAAADPQAERRCRSLGSHAFLHKPVPLRVLVSSVDQAPGAATAPTARLPHQPRDRPPLESAH